MADQFIRSRHALLIALKMQFATLKRRGGGVVVLRRRQRRHVHKQGRKDRIRLESIRILREDSESWLLIDKGGQAASLLLLLPLST
jgi:hypothetical protein